MNIPHPGDLRHRISILTVINTVNGNGYSTEQEIPICRVWAGITNDSSRFFNSANTDDTEKSLCFIIRWRKDIHEGMWVQYGDDRYLITEVFEYDFRKRYMKLTARLTEAIH